MVGFFMFLFVVLAFFLVLFILIQQGKGDMGLGSLSKGSQLLFGGAGGQEFFEKVTWIMGALFLAGALFLTIMKTKVTEQSRLATYRAPITQQQKTPAKGVIPKQTADKK
jgi:protein translocase SecG subunit